MRHFKRAIEEQLKTLISPDQGIEKGKRGTVVVREQIVGSRRRIEHILMDMIDKGIGIVPCPKEQRYNQRCTEQHNTRRHKRGQRSAQARIKRSSRKGTTR